MPLLAPTHHQSPLTRENSAPLPINGCISPDHLFHCPEIIISHKTLNFETTVSSFIRFTADETDHRCDHKSSGNMRNIKTFNRMRRTGKIQVFTQSLQSPQSPESSLGQERVNRRFFLIVLERESARSRSSAARSKSMASARFCISSRNSASQPLARPSKTHRRPPPSLRIPPE